MCGVGVEMEMGSVVVVYVYSYISKYSDAYYYESNFSFVVSQRRRIMASEG
jgi:hypothetical protein